MCRSSPPPSSALLVSPLLALVPTTTSLETQGKNWAGCTGCSPALCLGSLCPMAVMVGVHPWVVSVPRGSVWVVGGTPRPWWGAAVRAVYVWSLQCVSLGGDVDRGGSPAPCRFPAPLTQALLVPQQEHRRVCFGGAGEGPERAPAQRASAEPNLSCSPPAAARGLPDARQAARLCGSHDLLPVYLNPVPD